MCETLFYSVKKTARLLGGLTLGEVSQLCNDGVLESCHQGVVRYVSTDSLRAYATSLLEQS